MFIQGQKKREVDHVTQYPQYNNRRRYYNVRMLQYDATYRNIDTIDNEAK